VDPSGVRANMPASWLAQMAWDVYVLDDIQISDLTETGTPALALPPLPKTQEVDARTLQQWLSESNTVVVDLSTHKNYCKGHIPGSWFALRSLLKEALTKLPKAERYVLTSSPAELASFTAPEFTALTQTPVYVLIGGNSAWLESGYAMESDTANLASPTIDRYQRPYEGTNATAASMQAYLDWEFGLVEQLGRDGTHHFWVMDPR